MAKKRKAPSDFLKKYYELHETSKEPEIWKDLEIGDVVLYQISSHGRVRRKFTNVIINPFHSYRKCHDGTLNINRPTYLRVQIYYYENGERKKKHFEISRLVALNFIPIPEKYTNMGYTANELEVNHIKGGHEIYNNFVSNLEWCTTKENIEKAFETGLRHPPYGEKHHSTKFTESDVIQVCECIEKGMNVRETFVYIALSSPFSFEKFKNTFYSIKYHNSWNFISQNYKF